MSKSALFRSKFDNFEKLCALAMSPLSLVLWRICIKKWKNAKMKKYKNAKMKKMQKMIKR
jgi:hypothetical protein